MYMAMSTGGQVALTRTYLTGRWDSCRPAVLVDTNAGTSRVLDAYGDCLSGLALDSSGTIAATGDEGGVIRVGHPDEAPHLLLGHKGQVTNLAFSPDGKWLASAGEDNTLRLWPMPDLDTPPLNTLLHDELIAKLKSLTNLRAVRSLDDPTGWTIELGPFPGWKEVPEW
jgi:WD40 repeat protein